MASVSIQEKTRFANLSINIKDFPKPSIKEKTEKMVTINELLPFRIRITDIDIVGFGPNNVPPIPLQIIGTSNYIL
jgi:hypothetical protein